MGLGRKGRGQGGKEGAKEERKRPKRKGWGKGGKEGAREERKGLGEKGMGLGGKYRTRSSSRRKIKIKKISEREGLCQRGEEGTR